MNKVFLLLAIAVSAMVAVPSSSAQAPIGQGFGIAETTDPDTDTSAPAFAGNEVAWWAGTCDLTSSATGSGGVGVAEGGSNPPAAYGNCIDHPFERLFGTFPVPALPPLAPGVSPGDSGEDGWGYFDDFGNDSPIPSWRLSPARQAGSHPDGSASAWFARSPLVSEGSPTARYRAPDGAPKNIVVSLPPGVVGNPNAIPRCPASALQTVPTTCHPKTQVGVATLGIAAVSSGFPVYNVEPRDGKTAELIISGAGLPGLFSNVPIVATARTDGDFGVDAMALRIPAGFALLGQTVTLWGVPWARSHDAYRPVAAYCRDQGLGSNGMPIEGLQGGVEEGAGSLLCSQEPQSYDPSWGPIRPFLTTQTDCSDADPITRIFADNWHTPVTASADSAAPQPTNCEALEFDPSLGVRATSKAADSPTGLDVDLAVPQNNDPPSSVRNNPDDATGAPAYWKSVDGRATSHLDATVVTLPEGVSVNPSGATGLEGCSDAQIGLRQLGNPPLFNNGDPFDDDLSDGVECPDGSVIGTVTVKTPLLSEELSGQVVLGSPKSTDPQSGEMLRMFLVIRNRERGLVAKIYGSAVADPSTGRVTATFDNNPQLPFDTLSLDIKGGDRAPLALPRACASHGWSAELTPWSGNVPDLAGGAFTTDSNCAAGFSPGFSAGMDNRQGRGSGTFAFEFSRRDGEQYLRGLTARLPQGLLASVKDVPLCTSAQAAAAACPGGSKIGVVDAKAGAGDPFVLEQKGEVFLTHGYKGGEYGLAVKIRPIAGPFRGAMELSPIVVRQAIHVDRKTAQVTAISDPFPLIHHGVPLRVREVTVLVNRGGFMLNPSDCSQKQVGAAIGSDQGAIADATSAFQVASCADLAFEPKLSLRLTGRKQVRTGKHPGVRAVVKQRGMSEAGIERAEVRLPKTLALDVDNAQALCEFEDGTKPDLESHCSKGSIVGRARAVSPLLNDPLVGNVYFVKNVRRSSTGNLIRTLPMLIVALRGEIAINLKGESTVKRQKLVNVFDDIPDAPITQFNMNIKGGRNGILAVTRTRKAKINLCSAGRQVAEADMDGHNGRRHDSDVTMRKPCRAKRANAKAKKRAKAKRRANAKARR